MLVRDVASVDFTPYKVDLVAGGVPCQPFSHAGLARGDDERNLFEHAIRAVRECEPGAFLFENVPGLLRFAPYLASVTRRLSIGYTVGTHLVDAADYGRSGASGACSSARAPSRRVRTARAERCGTCCASWVHQGKACQAISYKPRCRGRTRRRRRWTRRRRWSLGRTARPAEPIASSSTTARLGTLPAASWHASIPVTYQLPATRSHAVRQIGNAAPPPLIRAFAAVIAQPGKAAVDHS